MKNLIFRGGGGFTKAIYKNELLKKVGLGQFLDLRGSGWQKRLE